MSKPYKAATVVLKRLNSTLFYLAEQVRVKEVNGDEVGWFFYKTRPAIFLKPGRNRLTVYAEWSESLYKHIKTAPRTLNVTVKEETVYTLYYLIDSERYLLVEGLQYEDKDWEKKLDEDSIVG